MLRSAALLQSNFAIFLHIALLRGWLLHTRRWPESSALATMTPEIHDICVVFHDTTDP
jgi:hypothetical protein